ncbi:MAG: hypothetical protein J5590_05215 [Clostridia bacterium]|nr:hypothetical protein [Clostridia bacterium]
MLLLQDRPIISAHQLYNECNRARIQNNKTQKELTGIIEQSIISKIDEESYHTKEMSVLSTVSTAASMPFYAQTQNINAAFRQVRNSVIQRGIAHARNTLAQRRGYIAENHHAETLNLDATIKKIKNHEPAYTPGSTQKASPDIVYGQKSAGVKYYKDAKSSGNAHTDPGYGDQIRIVPSDQEDDAKTNLLAEARKDELKGRYDAAKIKRQTAEKIDSVIRSEDGSKSTPLTKKQADKLSKAFSVDKEGNTVVDEKIIDEVYKEIGTEGKVNKAKFINELKGIGIAAAIGVGIGITITALVELASSGISAANIDKIITDSLTAGAESGILSVASYGINKLTTNVLQSAFKVNMLNNFGYTLNFAAAGLISIIVFSTYQFVKMKINGVETSIALKAVGRQAAFSLSVLAVSIIAQGVYGGVAGIIVSTTIGVIYIAYNVKTTLHNKRIAEKIREYTIEQYKPVLLEGLM